MTQTPTLILTDARIRTMDPARPFAEALAVCAGHLLAVGPAQEVEALAGPGTKIVRLGGRAVMPGLIDSHTHGLWGACRDLFEVYVGLSGSLRLLLDSIAARVAQTPPGEWIVAGPWRPFERPSLGTVPRALLDTIAPNHPVVVKDLSQHNMWLNSEGLRRIGFGPDSPAIPGGEIERDASGVPTGILIEAATAPVHPQIAPTAAQLSQAVLHMAGYFHAQGITGFKEPMAFAPELKAYAEADLAGRLNLHVGAHLTRYSAITGDWVPMEDIAALRARYRSPHLHTAFAKLFLDGVPVARTAAFCDPYPGTDPAMHDPEAMLLVPPARLNADVTALDAAGLTVKMHAVGDRAIQAGLDAIEAARHANGASGLRHEIAHANFIRRQDLARFAALGAVAEMSPKLWFPNPVTPGQRAVLGDARAESCHPVRSLLDAGAEVIYGSDWPAAAPDANPWTGIAGMVTRADPAGLFDGHVGADQAIALDRALPIFTVNGARALRLEQTTGALRPGLSADFIVLDAPIETLTAAELGAVQPRQTWFEGAMVFEA
ncbi:amidohydrolase [Pararhodobacter zhoushanensis]|uniref:amidohydrolase n=1 Tax=Pararhodobacter zhoushanensis TaxID=2479545 RepID=UPI000F8E6A42|nr:amidohydrolase [Pararhodobacter zhoushanensis]